MSKIIQPFGAIAKKITLEIDVKGLVKVIAVHTSAGIGLPEVTMTPPETMAIMAKVISDVLMAMSQQEQQRQANKILMFDGGNSETKKTD